ncbi:hypothetical protein E2C01_080609 [Portunus trituberculatus]|uniref:Uncharacterized protein n=1 Tax=Portunus trituberculatus TaxID=210409 RepID=A0A5B7ITW1_PORTR|nr:hypothetical protein [Portunus trituberculatus]
MAVFHVVYTGRKFRRTRKSTNALILCGWQLERSYTTETTRVRHRWPGYRRGRGTKRVRRNKVCTAGRGVCTPTGWVVRVHESLVIWVEGLPRCASVVKCVGGDEALYR